VSGLTGVVQIAVGDSFSCALTSAGGVQCWGANDVGELGNGTSGPGADSSVPVQVSGLTSGVVAIAASDATVCAALLSGQVNCWGYNSAGELCTGSVGTPAMSDTPVTVGSFTSDGSVGISAGFGGTVCALNSSQQAFCWGYNGDSQLGDGSTSNSGTPGAVQGF
jgi:alpha-tubulin suppressor-like RCC1 family protein